MLVPEMKSKTLSELIFGEVLGNVDPRFLTYCGVNNPADIDIQDVYKLPTVALILNRLHMFIPKVQISMNVALAINVLSKNPTMPLFLLAELVRFAASTQGTHLVTMEHFKAFNTGVFEGVSPETLELMANNYKLGDAQVFERADFWNRAAKGLPYLNPQ